MEVQSVLFRKDKFTKKKAEKWLKENDYKVKKVDTTPTLYRYRQLEPSLFHKDKYKIKSFKGKDIQAVIGVRKRKKKKIM